MLLRKTRMLIVVILLNSFLMPVAHADDGTVLNAILNVLNATMLIHNTTSNLINVNSSMSPPGTNETAIQNATLASIAENYLIANSKYLRKEVEDSNWGLYAMPAQAGGSAQSVFLENHKKFFCSKNSEVEWGMDNKQCESSINEHGDLKISSLLEPSIYIGVQSTFAEGIIRNLTTPFPSETIKKLAETYNSPDGLGTPAKKNRLAQLMVKQTAFSAARNSLREIYAARMPISKEEPQFSMMSLIENESGRRFKDAAWYDKVKDSSSEALLREMVHMEAFRLWMDYHRYRQNERIETLLAVSTAQAVDQSIQLIESMPDK